MTIGPVQLNVLGLQHPDRTFTAPDHRGAGAVAEDRHRPGDRRRGDPQGRVRRTRGHAGLQGATPTLSFRGAAALSFSRRSTPSCSSCAMASSAAGPVVREEPRAFLISRGMQRQAALGWFIDAVGFTAAAAEQRIGFVSAAGRDHRISRRARSMMSTPPRGESRRHRCGRWLTVQAWGLWAIARSSRRTDRGIGALPIEQRATPP